jgi:hypothetical protein
MSNQLDIISVFTDEEHCAHAVERVRREKVDSFRVFAPVPSEKISESIGLGRSPVRRWVLTGGILGIISGFALTIGTSMEWNLDAGGKPVASIPPYVIIAFELMVLFGGILAVLGFLFHARMPALEPISGYLPRFGSDRFGLAVRCSEADGARVEALLRAAGAEEIIRQSAESSA